MDKKDRSAELIVAQLNLGNLEGMPLERQDWENQTKKRIGAQMDMYKEIYTDPAYSAYMGFTADPFVKLTSYAARAAARTRSAGGDESFPPLVDVSNLRAIGYGAAINTAGSCTTYFYGSSKFLNLDEQGHIPEAEKQELAQLYLRDPIAQDTINRATYGVVMANMQTAWQYMDCKRTIGEDGTVSINGEAGALERLAAESEDI